MKKTGLPQVYTLVDPYLSLEVKLGLQGDLKLSILKGYSLSAFSHHRGFDTFGDMFGQAHKDLKVVYITPFHKFLCNKYHK